MPLFTREHQIDMLLVYGEVRKYRREAKALYGQRYPDRAQPHDKYFPWLERPLKTERIEEEPNEFIVSEQAEINTLACIEVRIRPLQLDKLLPILELDGKAHLSTRYTTIFMKPITNGGWSFARENPHLFRQGAFQESFGVNVWIGVIGTRIVGPIFFENLLTADQYLQFLSNEIADFLENLPINEYFHIYYQQDGAPAHNARRQWRCGLST
ncbi:hypothetical protein NQ318_011732 [Aromia moschata]|uniref:Transposase n=1 Tax=Aromia moschata TaxID=1265417 RepID=A0AAV8XV83_9CUCU|nr:hypothetical protein NQ318_011732 [Aromia moschata]